MSGCLIGDARRRPWSFRGARKAGVGERNGVRESLLDLSTIYDSHVTILLIRA